jgi:hypothetical protein
MNEIFVAGLVKAMTANKVQHGENTPTVQIRYVGNMYQRGHIFKVEGTKFEGNMNEILEAAERAGVTLDKLTSKPDPVIERAERKLAQAKAASKPR